MANDRPPPSRSGRRGFLKAGGVAVATGASLGATAVAQAAQAALTRTHADDVQHRIEPFYGAHQAGIVTPQQSHTYVAAFDLTTGKRDEVIALLREWTGAAARMTKGQPPAPLDNAEDKPAPHSADVLGLGASALTVTFGFGPGLFATQDGNDRSGLARRRPPALA